MKRLLLSLALSVITYSSTISAEVFQVGDIRIQGLQRVSAGTVFAALPVSVGDLLDEAAVRNATRALFRTGYFSDVIVARENAVLVIALVERPAVTEINLEGNKAIETDQLLGALRDNGLAEGQIFREIILDNMRQELERQYVGQGRYGALVETEVENLPRNRVRINIDIDEGSVAKIRHVNIVGNRDFEEEELLDQFELGIGGWFSWFSGKDKYSREKLSGDLEALESWYLDRGYLQFEIDSTQVSISPDKESVFVTINITEGNVFKVGEIQLAGELVIPEEDVRSLVLLKEGVDFSQSLMTSTNELITRRLGNEGYTFAEVEGFPEIDEESNTAKITFLVKPGMRAYVRRIEFRGNSKTADEVLRREMRQMEGGSANTQLIEHSKVRLERLGFFKEVNVENLPVAGTNDQIDVVYTVEEQPSGSVGASVGFAQGTGLILGANLSENNFLGTGKQVGIGINRSTYQTSLNFRFTEPYFTVDGVSVGYGLFARESDFDEINIASFSTNSYGATVNWSYPISETQRMGFGVGYESLDLESGLFPSKEISDFIDNNGDLFDVFNVNANWISSTLNRGIFATRGARQSLGVEMTVPGSGLEYYKVTYDGQYLRPLTRSLTLKLSTELGYGDSYGDTSQLPFFKNFYGGGLGSVRGFKRNTLGPRDTPCDLLEPPCTTVFVDDPDPIGGNVKIGFTAEVIFPLPFLKDQRSVQSTFFFDAGNIFNTDCGTFVENGIQRDQVNCFEPDLAELRYSMGVGATWLSGFGPITFSIAKPFNGSEDDEEEIFQFSLGNQF